VDVSREQLNAVTTAAQRQTAESLGPGCEPVACAAVCGYVAAKLDAALEAARVAGAAIACVTGCNYCCHQRVSVFPHEAIALWRHLRTAVAPPVAAVIERRLRETAAAVDGMTPQEHHVAVIGCAFLIDGRCSAYEVRPSACAAYHSLSKARCEHAYTHAGDAGTPGNSRPALLDYQVLGDALIEATRSGLASAGRPGGKRELHQALRVLLDDPQAVERWCTGEDLG